jgi:L-lactate dehydrogenase complex protein LldG
MVMDAKTAILARAREAIERSQEGRPVREIPRNYIREGQHAPGSDEVVAEMIEKLEDYSAQVVEARDDQAIEDAIAKFLSEAKLPRLSFPPASMISSRRRLDAISERYARIRGRTLFRHWNWTISMPL